MHWHWWYLAVSEAAAFAGFAVGLLRLRRAGRLGKFAHQRLPGAGTPLPAATVTLFGLDADGQPVIVSDQRVPVAGGVFYEETFTGGETVTRWRVSFSQTR